MIMLHSAWRTRSPDEFAISQDMMEELEGYQIYSDWWWVLLAVTQDTKEELDVQFSLACEARVFVTQSGKRLTNQPYGAQNCAGLYLTSAWGDGPCTVLTYK